MKRLVYGIVAAGLAVGLVGCGESGGGYWPASPIAPTATAGQVQPLAGTVSDNVAFGADSSGLVSGGYADAGASVLAGCPLLSDLGVSFGIGAPSSSLFASVKGNIAAASKKRSLSSSTGTYANVSTSVTTTNGSYVDYTVDYNMYVKFLDANGAALAVVSAPSLSGTTDTFKNLVADFTKVKTMAYYGTYTMTVTPKTTSSSGQVCSSIQASTCTTNSYNYKVVGTFGSSTDPCIVSNLNSTSLKVYSTSSMAVTGTINGTAVASTVSSKVYGTESITVDNKSYNVFSCTGSYGVGTVETTAGSSSVKYVGTSSGFSIYVNGTCVYSYPTSSK